MPCGRRPGGCGARGRRPTGRSRAGGPGAKVSRGRGCRRAGRSGRTSRRLASRCSSGPRGAGGRAARHDLTAVLADQILPQAEFQRLEPRIGLSARTGIEDDRGARVVAGLGKLAFDVSPQIAFRITALFRVAQPRIGGVRSLLAAGPGRGGGRGSAASAGSRPTASALSAGSALCGRSGGAGPARAAATLAGPAARIASRAVILDVALLQGLRRSDVTQVRPRAGTLRRIGDDLFGTRALPVESPHGRRRIVLVVRDHLSPGRDPCSGQEGDGGAAKREVRDLAHPRSPLR